MDSFIAVSVDPVPHAHDCKFTFRVSFVNVGIRPRLKYRYRYRYCLDHLEHLKTQCLTLLITHNLDWFFKASIHADWQRLPHNAVSHAPTRLCGTGT